MSKPMFGKWANDIESAQLSAQTIPKNLEWRKSVTRLHRYGICKSGSRPLGHPPGPWRQYPSSPHFLYWPFIDYLIIPYLLTKSEIILGMDLADEMQFALKNCFSLAGPIPRMIFTIILGTWTQSMKDSITWNSISLKPSVSRMVTAIYRELLSFNHILYMTKGYSWSPVQSDHNGYQLRMHKHPYVFDICWYFLSILFIVFHCFFCLRDGLRW